jgi:hypothetical protein
MEKPQTVWLGVNLLWASLAISVIASALDPTGIMHKQSIPLPVVVLLVTVLTVMALLTYMISIGKNWARIVLLVWIVGTALLSLQFIPDLLKLSLVAGITNILQTVLQLTAMVLIFTPSAGPWFKNKS